MLYLHHIYLIMYVLKYLFEQNKDCDLRKVYWISFLRFKLINFQLYAFMDIWNITQNYTKLRNNFTIRKLKHN